MNEEKFLFDLNDIFYNEREGKYMLFKTDNELPKNEGAGTGSLFVKLKGGESVRGVFVGDPVDFMKAFKEGDKPSFRFRINFVTQENGAYVAKIFEQGKTSYQALRTLNDQGYELDKHIMIISRQGDTKDTTTYSILPAPKGNLTTEQSEQVSKVKLNDLKK